MFQKRVLVVIMTFMVSPVFAAVKCGKFEIDYFRVDKAEGGSGKTKITYFVNEKTYIDKAEGGNGMTVVKVPLIVSRKLLKGLEEGRSYCFEGQAKAGEKFKVTKITPESVNEDQAVEPDESSSHK